MKTIGYSIRSLLLASLLASGRASNDRTISSIHPVPSARYKYTEDRRQLQNDEETIVLFFHGTVINDLWEPISGAQVQFWHTDKRGVYNHPGDLNSRGNLPLLPDFQYFGTSTSDDEGNFDFITYRPGVYASRPITHIHYKVFVDGAEVLTSQFYFADEAASQQYSNMMVLELESLIPQSTDDAMVAEYFRTQGNAAPTTSTSYFHTSKTIVVDMNLGGTVGTTPSQMEGPFYPVVDFFDAGNDLTRPATTTTSTTDATTEIANSTSSSGTVDSTSTSSHTSATSDFISRTWLLSIRSMFAVAVACHL
jgi:protocatechuate 3,4-dioxygenase beta subunit